MRFDPTTSRFFFSVIIRPLRFFCANVEFPDTLLQSSGVYSTPVQTNVISATQMQTAGVSATTMQLCGVPALTRTNAVIGLSLRQSTFSSLLYTAKKIQSTYTKAGFTSNPNDFTPKSKKFMPNSINPSRHPGLGLINSLSFCAINPELHKP